MSLHRLFLLALLGVLSTCPLSRLEAGPITSAAFQGGEVVVDYNGLGLPFFNATPLSIAGDTYSTSNGFLRYASSFGSIVGRTGEAIGTDDDLAYIDIVLGTAVLRAGGYIGTPDIWSATVTFYDQADLLLGTVLAASANGGGAFAGWEADSGLIQRIRVQDTAANGLIIILDDLTKEGFTPNAQAVPEPASLALLGLSALAVIGYTCRRRSNLMIAG